MRPPTRRQREVLARMARSDEDNELVYERGVGYVGEGGDDPVSGRTVYALLRLCAIHLVGGREGDYEVYELTGTGRDLVRDEAKALDALGRALRGEEGPCF